MLPTLLIAGGALTVLHSVPLPHINFFLLNVMHLVHDIDHWLYLSYLL